MTTQEIPLTNTPQNFSIALAGTTYQFTLRWIEEGLQSWVLDIADNLGTPLIQGIPLITGIDLLAPYKYLGIAGELHVGTDGNLTAQPTFANLGINSHLYFVTP